MATHSSALAWKTPWMEEPDKLHSMWSQRVGHDSATSLVLVMTSKEGMVGSSRDAEGQNEI